ncbi:MAG: outer membrane beta-barrel protein [Hyphomonadaceae bacterium]|nr:outer membrane beta-barrel protein [Hyphomonadaceae bacterium]
MKRTALSLLLLASLAPLVAPAQADENPWQIRARVIGVLPDEGADLSAGTTALPGDVEIGDQYVPELDITYFFNENIAAELILGVTPHDVKATGAEVPGAFGPADVDLGDVWLLPPTLTLQYHFRNDSQFTPYVGAGVNATFFFNEDEGDVADSIDYDSSFGPALQVGFDYDMDGEEGGWLLNVDVKKVWINTDVTVDLSTALGPTLGTSEVLVDADVDINPLIVGIGFGYKY